jgi:predicted  nucleic acid-binding Zn-ribbon protein
MKSSIDQIKKKNSVESFFSRLDQIKDRISELEDKLDVLEHADEAFKK